MLKKITFLWCFTVPVVSFAQESVETVMARMKPDIAVEIAYQETRYMGLFDDDWQGSGYLYAATPNVLLKQQTKPELESMAAVGEQLTYAKPATKTYHQLQMDESNPMMASLSAFKGMMTGNLIYLRQNYSLNFEALASSWKLEMIAKESEADEPALKIIMQGLNEQAANQMEVILPDGDRSLYVLSQAQQGGAIKVKLNGLLQSLTGN